MPCGLPQVFGNAGVTVGERRTRAVLGIGTGTIDRAGAVSHNRAFELVAVAQLVERQVVVLDVAGSSPVGHPL